MNGSAVQSNRPVSVKGLVAGLVVLAVIIVGTIGWNAARSSSGADHFTIDMLDYAFEPSQMVWTVGDTVTITLINASDAHPGKAHEWMVGRKPNTEDSVFGEHVTDGFETDFFDGVAVNVVGGSNLNMLMAGAATLSGQPPMSLMAPGAMDDMEMEEDMEGFMPVVGDFGDLTISFTVPDKPGEWEYGCFQQSGQHFTNGMHGTITVVEG